jgi:hypothetical protein
MSRVVLVCALVLCGCLSAGCGGSSLQKVARQDSKESLGDPHPRITHTETVRIVDGEKEAVVQMQGHFTIVPHCPFVTAGSKSRCHMLHPRNVVLTFSLPNPEASHGYSTISASQISRIARARHARPLFGIFPDFVNEIVRCAIPRGSPPGGTIAGTCSTEALPYPRVRRAEFTEHWPQSRPTGSRNKAGWIVTFSRDGRVESIRVTGQPPQFRK